MVKRILHLLVSSKFSGAENVVCQIIDIFGNDDGFEMYYCSPDGPIKQNLQSRGIQFVPLKSVSIEEVRRVVTKVKPSIIHAHDMRASFYASISAPRVPLISHIHNNDFNSRHISLKSILYLISARKARHIFWVSKSSYEGYYFHKWFKRKSTILYNVININALEKEASRIPPKKSYDIIYLGRLVYLKNPQRLLRILKKVLTINNKIRIAILGDGELRDEIIKIIDDNSMYMNIDCLGFISNPYPILKDAKCMVMTSRTEGLPMCALEAMSLAVPIVSTPVGGMVELISNGVDGYLSDDDDNLALYLNNLVSDEELHSKMSVAAKNKMKKLLDLNNYRNSLLSAYNNL